MVNPIDKRYGLVRNKYQWIINSSTLIEEVPEAETKNMLINLPTISFIPFNSLHQYIDDEARIGNIVISFIKQ